MSHLHSYLRRSTLPLLVVLCLAALSFSYAFADDSARPLAVTVIGDPDAAVAGKFAVGYASVGSKALTVTGVIDFLGAGTVHSYFTQGGGNNMQITTNVDEANVVGDASRSQWKVVMGSNLDWFSIRRSPAGGTYNEDALFFIQGSTGNVGIATVDTGNAAAIPFGPVAKLHVETTSEDAIWGVTSSTSSSGVFGYATATTGDNEGVTGESLSTDGTGVFGRAWTTTGINFGVYGLSYSMAGSGLRGYALATSGANCGACAGTNSTAGFGVIGGAYATSGANIGVVGETYSPSGIGVYGYWPSPGSGWAGFFEGDLAATGYTSIGGDLDVSGTLWKAAGAFRIDHPLDPENMFLNHSLVESPDMKNIYDGVVTLDENGEAWVQMADWFEALNQDFRYQLTPSGESMPDLYIAQGIQDNRFQIAGGVAGLQVSWQVTGIRHDAYAEANRIPVEEDKSASDSASPTKPASPVEPPQLESWPPEPDPSHRP